MEYEAGLIGQSMTHLLDELSAYVPLVQIS